MRGFIAGLRDRHLLRLREDSSEGQAQVQA